MQKIIAQKKNGYITCELDVSREEWLEALEDENTSTGCVEALLRFYYMPHHRGSCKQTAREMGGTAASLNSYIVQFGKNVLRRFHRFEIFKEDGQPSFWLVPMCQGKDMEKGEDGTFEWELRPELADALRTYLYRFLVKQYKLLRKDLPINSEKEGELYKWETVRDCAGKDVNYIAEYFLKSNLVDSPRYNPVVSHMLKEKPAAYKKILSALTQEDVPLGERLLRFKQSMAVALADDEEMKNKNGKANDERTASAVLTCRLPQKYTFYKYDVYQKFCQYLGIESKSTGECYGHFLELLQPLKTIIEADRELYEIVAESLKGQAENHLLLAQDVLWELMVMHPRRLDFIFPLAWRPRYWLVGFNFSHSGSQLKRFFAEGLWEGRFKKEDKKQLPEARKIKSGDILILKSTFFKSQHIPCFRISGVGIVKDILEDETLNDGRISVRCTVDYVNRDKTDFDKSKNTKYQSTIHECKRNEEDIIDYVNKILNMEQPKKYEEYTRLLLTNRNLVLTGAPGTGKTYLAHEIAKEMQAEIAMVQFHPSYDYTDFVEGLRPVADADGRVGFERRDGVFKAFCAQALENEKESKKSIKVLEQERSVREQIEDFIDEAMEASTDFETAGTKNKFTIIENRERSILIDIPGNKSAYRIALPKSDLWSLLENNAQISGGKELQQYFQRKYRTQQDSYTYVLYEKLKGRKKKTVPKVLEQVKQKPFVFIIDEINRGEISKIFGELFFSVDPGYRGERGKVSTQYQNLVEEGDPFEKGFFVPENVYIIGTMNDIDRNVESMDFAIRRRFAWKEVTADESFEHIIDTDKELSEWKERIHSRMNHLNAAICKEELLLGQAYRIGAAYFLKIKQYAQDDKDTAFEKLWNYHLKGLLEEYLRGNPESEKHLAELKAAYNDEEKHDGQSQNDGQQ